MTAADLTGVLAGEPYGFHPAEPPEGPPHQVIGSSSQAGLAAVQRRYVPTNPSGGAVTAPTPAPPDDATPSLVELDAKEALLAAVLAWDEAVTVRQGTVQAYTALRTAVREYREVAR